MQRSRMGLLRDRVLSPGTLQRPSPGYEGPLVPAEQKCIHDTLLQVTLTAHFSLYTGTRSSLPKALQPAGLGTKQADTQY